MTDHDVNSAPYSHAKLRHALRSRVRDSIINLLEPGEKLVFLDAPEHSNVGDHAILLGAHQLVANAGATVAYMSSIQTNSWQAITQRASAKILLQGGGNFGDLWDEHQAFREAVLTLYPQREIIMLPQSTNFRSKANLHRAQRIVGEHSSVTLMARDGTSFAFLEKYFDARVLLCPDAALALSIQRSEFPRQEAVALLRTDKEKKGDVAGTLGGVPTRDWLDSSPPGKTTWPGFVQRARARLRPYRRWRMANPLLTASFLPTARYHLHRGIDILSEGDVVITDRLHGHILCFVMGIPHVVLDNSYGKVFSFVDTWTKGSPLVRVARSASDAYDLAMELRSGISAYGVDDTC